MTAPLDREAAGATWDFACPDWIERLRDGRSLVPPLPLFRERADQAVGVFNKLRLPDVPEQPMMADAAGEWFRDIVRAVFGSLDDDGVRHVSEVFGLVPKKNSKTTGGAAIMLTALLVNRRPRAEFLLIGPTHDIADLAFQQVEGMIAADPEGYLQKRFQVQEHRKTIRDRVNGAALKIKTFDMKVMTGTKPAGVLLDELHVMSSIGHASRVVGQIRGGLLPNPEGFLIIITTQSDESPAGVFRGELQYARGVRDGRIREHVRMLPILYEFPEDMQTGKDRPWEDPDLWPMVLPNLGKSITIDRLIADYAQAREKGEEEVRRWASQHLNVEIGLALHSDRWRGADYWEGAAETDLTLDVLIERCDVAVVGGDAGGLDDLFGLCVAGRCKVTRDWLYWHHAWAQRDVLELRKDIAEPLRDFEREGTLTLCDSATQDIEEFVAIVKRLDEAGVLPEKWAIWLDPAGIAPLVDELAMAGIAGERIAAAGQGWRLSSAAMALERKLKNGTLWHDGSRMMAWVVGNAKAEVKGSNVIITKQVSGRAKIDPLIAAFNATRGLERNPEPAGQSVYQGRGVLAL